MLETLKLIKLDENWLEACVDLAIDTFTKEPWNDVFESRDQVRTFYKNHMDNNYFVGYGVVLENELVGLSVGMMKPWIKGMEYYIDEFCIGFSYQGQGIGCKFVGLIEEAIKEEGMNAIILNTSKDYPSKTFYEKCGFEVIEDLVVLAK